MAETRYELEQRLFEEALDYAPGPERDAFVQAACGGDWELADSILGLLAYDDSAEALFASGTETLVNLAASAPLSGAGSRTQSIIGTSIGPYQVLELIGEGGCGSVFVAEQHHPIQRRVALKIIRLGMDTEAVITRFESERRALALMDHPNIAHVLDAGSTSGGLPYFVMELAQGSNICEYCDENRLSIAARLNLFVKVCQAIQHAHQKGMVHRDIKPSNILIPLKDGTAVPKVIDFGIVKAINIPLSDQHLLTQNLQMIGTPAYMSPEQAEGRGLEIDTRSDIYSLGTLLHELLTGQPPFDPAELGRCGMSELLRTLREVDPPVPSAVLAGLDQDELTRRANCRGVDAGTLLSAVRGDLDWITSKTLEKDRARRYESAHALAADIGRHLAHEPVEARPPTRPYLLRKWMRRNRTVFAATVAVVGSLLLSTIVSTRFYWNERKALDNLSQSEEVQTKLRHETERRRAEAKALHILSETQAKITRAVVLLRNKDFPAADALVAGVPLIPPSPEAADVFRRLADWHALNGRWKETVERAGYLYQIDQYDADNYPSLDGFRLGTAMLETGDMAGYDHFRRSIISRFSASANVIYAERTVKMALLAPASEEQMQELEPLIEISAASLEGLPLSRDTPSYLRWRMISISLGEYRRGNFELAEQWARKCLAQSPPNARRDATARILLACALFQQGHPEEARSELVPASEVLNVKLRDMTLFRPDEFWPDWIIARILLREAQALMP